MPHSLVHTHTYVRWKKNHFGEPWYKCDDPHCYHTAARSRIVGKASICAVCHVKEFVLTKEDLKRSRPRCPDCSTTKEALARKALRAELETVLRDVI